MGISDDSYDAVLIKPGRSSSEPTVVTVNCPDKVGLGCDCCRIILEFGLRITRADFLTDGKWCYIVFWVVPHPNARKIDWDCLKNRIINASPSSLLPFCFDHGSVSRNEPPALYLLKCCFVDRKGLLHDVTEALTELHFTIQRLKVMTTPDGRVIHLFFITDNMELLHTRKRQDDMRQYIIDGFKEHCISCELRLAGPEYGSMHAFTSLSEAVADELISCDLSAKESSKQTQHSETKLHKKASVTVDNLLSPTHTSLKIQCNDRKGLFYDILRTSKDCDIKIAYGRFSPSSEGLWNMDLFVQQKQTKIMDSKVQEILCSRLEEEILHPLRMIITNRGPDKELLVANPVELCGKGRPRVVYDVTLALKKLGICIFLAEIGRHEAQERQWEVYRFLLEETSEFPLTSVVVRRQILDRVRKTLMGW